LTSTKNRQIIVNYNPNILHVSPIISYNIHHTDIQYYDKQLIDNSNSQSKQIKRLHTYHVDSSKPMNILSITDKTCVSKHAFAIYTSSPTRVPSVEDNESEEKEKDEEEEKDSYVRKSGHESVLSWYENGQLKGRNNYVDGQRHGLCETWYDNGQLSSRINYLSDKYHGPSEYWYDNGQLESKRNYDGGKECGLYQYWYKNGQLRLEFSNTNGERNGPCQSWHHDG